MSYLFHKIKQKFSQAVTMSVLLYNHTTWTPTHRHTSGCQPAKTYIDQLYVDTGCCLQDLLSVIADMDWWRERVERTHAVGRLWWRWIVPNNMFLLFDGCLNIFILLQVFYLSSKVNESIHFLFVSMQTPCN